ncbi:MAG TPA: metal ABC transporter substrate-binding protein [Gaiellaceae bacterium]|nr:metal ABC transporter substrate-binding protein [Gaiellaceae bacterium]
MALALVGGCGGSSAAAPEQRSVVAAFYPIAFAAEQIGGDTVQVDNLTPAGAEPHDVELSPRHVGKVREADFVFYLGSGFQPALERAVDGAKGTTVDLLDGLRLRPAVGEEHGLDPHVWLDPVLYSRMARRIGDTLGRPAPARAFARRLGVLDGEYRRGLASCKRREIVTSHAAFGYLAARYHLTQIPITGVSPEAEPTPRELQKVVRAVRAHGATTVFFETLVSPDLARTVARETGARTAALDPIEGLTKDELAAGENYLSIMRANLRTLRQALACR